MHNSTFQWIVKVTLINPLCIREREPREENQKPIHDPNDARMEDMRKALKNLTRQMAKLKTDPNVPAQPPPRNAMGYIRPNNPQILQRDRRNDDQNIQTPVRKDINNLKQEEEYEEELIPIEEEEEGVEQEFYKGEASPKILFTQDEFDKSKEIPLDPEHEIFGVSKTQYQDISNNFLGEVQRKYELRSFTIKVPDPNPNRTKKTPAKKTPKK